MVGPGPRHHRRASLRHDRAGVDRTAVRGRAGPARQRAIPPGAGQGRAGPGARRHPPEPPAPALPHRLISRSARLVVATGASYVGDDMDPAPPATPLPPPPLTPERRRFLSRLSIGLSAAMAAVMGVPVVGFLLSPLTRRTPRVWRPVGRVDGFKVG